MTKKRGFSALERISRIVEDETLPEVEGSGDITLAREEVLPDKLKVADVLAPDSPYRVIDAETGS